MHWGWIVLISLVSVGLLAYVALRIMAKGFEK